MSIDKVKEFVELAKEKGACALKYEDKSFKVSVEFPVAGQALSQVVAPQVQSSPVVSESPVQTPSAPKGNFHEIKSPFVGTFYGQPAPGKPAYVNVGDRVSKGQTLCILEAMKIMNEIEADIDGEIVEICVNNESFVEYDQVLFRIKK